MSYVIQNFYKPQRALIIGSRFKYLIFNNQTTQIFIFLKLSALRLFLPSLSFNSKTRYWGFYRIFFFNYQFKLFLIRDQRAVSTYSNRLTQSVFYKFYLNASRFMSEFQAVRLYSLMQCR